MTYTYRLRSQTAPLSGPETNNSPMRPGGGSVGNNSWLSDGSGKMVDEGIPTTFSRTITIGPLPAIPARSATSHGGSKNSNDNKLSKTHGGVISSTLREGGAQAWSTPPKPTKLQPLVATTDEPIAVPEETGISVGLMRIADSLSRRVLPWQAALCPRSIESLFDLRLSVMQNKHQQFMNQMKKKLSDKVENFIRKKDDEVDAWMQREIINWQSSMYKNDVDLTAFVKKDMDRVSDRGSAQEVAYFKREALMASELDDYERDATREQLNNFRRVVRKTDSKNKNVTASEMQMKALQESIARAQSLTTKETAKAQRYLISYTSPVLSLIPYSHTIPCTLYLIPYISPILYLIPYKGHHKEAGGSSRLALHPSGQCDDRFRE